MVCCSLCLAPSIESPVSHLPTVFYSVDRSLSRTLAEPVYEILFIGFAVIATVYAIVWDFLMDWGYFQKNSKNRFLRDELLYPHKWVRRFPAALYDRCSVIFSCTMSPFRRILFCDARGFYFYPRTILVCLATGLHFLPFSWAVLRYCVDFSGICTGSRTSKFRIVATSER